MKEITCLIPGCDCTKIQARGWCGPHYKRWYRHGDPLATINRRAPNGATLAERIEYVGYDVVQRRADLSPCWEWKGLTDKGGYGRLWDGERVRAAHRASYELWVGELPAELHACHHCDNRICINPEHLFPGDDDDNMADMVNKSRSANGERRPQHKLTDAQVAALRAEYTGSRGEQTALAAKYGIGQPMVSMLVNGKARNKETNWEALNRDAGLAGVRGSII